MDKRGIAPLIATIILIVLAVGLGVLVMNFGRAQIEETARCSVNVGLDVVELNDQKQVCVDKSANQIYMVLDNGGTIEVKSVRVRILGSKAILVTDIEDEIEKLGTLVKYLNYDYNKYGDVQQLKLTPRINLYGQDEFCDQQSIIIENVRECVK